MNCPACGADNREGAHFCRQCGAELAKPVESTVDAVEPEPAVEMSEGLPEEAVPEDESRGESSGELEPIAETWEVPPQVTAPGNGAVELPVEEGAEDEVESIGEPEAEVPVPPEETEIEEAEEPVPPQAWDEESEKAELPELDEEVLAFWRDGSRPLTPAVPGTRFADRYAVVEVLDVQDSEILYLAHDLRRCWQCRFAGNEPADPFCAQCGASLDRRVEVHLLEVRDDSAEPANGEPVGARLTDGGRSFLVLGEPEPVSIPEAPLPRPGIHLVIGQRSDPGQVRELDEDSLLAITIAPTYESRTGPMLGLFAVADGMGGHEGGEVASKLALQTLADRVLRTIMLPELAGEMILEEDITVRLRRAFVAANDDVYLSRKKSSNDMGTTLTAVFVRDDRLFLAHVGDCRAYRWNADGLKQLTIDHSVVASMIAEGQAEPAEIYTHPHRSVIYRCVGDKPVVEVDTDVLPLAPGDRIVVCCDGLWEMLHDEGIEDVMMQEADPQVACGLLVDRANAAGGEDNISVIVVQVEAA